MESQRSHRAVGWLLAAGAAAVVWWAWPVIRSLGAQVLWGYAIMALALPFAKLYEKKLSSTLSAALALLSLGALTAGAVLVMLPPLVSQGRQLGAQAPQMWERLTAAVQQVSQWLENRGITLAGMDFTQAEGWLAKAGAGVLRWAGSLAGAVGRFLLAPALAFYFLRDRQAIARGLCLWIPLGRRARVIAALREARRELAGFCRGQALLSLAVGGLTALGLGLAGVPAWLMLGLLMGIMELIPYLGPLLAGIPAVLFALPMGWGKALWALGVVVAVQQLEGMILSPALMAGATRLHPAVVLLAISAGGMIGGIWGMLLALPAVVSLRGLWRVLSRPAP